MKVLDSVNTSHVELEVIECDCGFHLGIDGTYLGTYLDQVGDIVMDCPSCGAKINTTRTTSPDQVKLRPDGIARRRGT